MAPYLAVERSEALIEAKIFAVAWSMEGDGELGDEPAWTSTHHNDSISQQDRLLDAVGHENDGAPLLLPQVEQLVLHDGACLHVKRRERLIHQQERGVVGEGAGEVRPLAHPTGELAWEGIGEALEADRAQLDHGPFPPFATRDSSQLQSEGDVVDGAQPGKQRIFLKDHVHPVVLDRGPLGLLGCSSVVKGDPAGAGSEESGQHSEQGALAASGWSKQDHELAMADIKVEILEDGHCAVATRERYREPTSLDSTIDAVLASWLGSAVQQPLRLYGPWRAALRRDGSCACARDHGRFPLVVG